MTMYYFELILVCAVFVTGIIYFLDKFYWGKRRQLAFNALQDASKHEQADKVLALPKWIEYACSFFPILLIVLLLRSFLVEPFHIPSGSLKPSLLPGEFIIANKFAYGIRLPVIHNKILSIGEPKLGDIVVFRWPVDPTKNFIKRIVGIPGDHVSYINKVLYINDVPVLQEFIRETEDDGDQGGSWPVIENLENLAGVKHPIYLRPEMPAQDFDVVVPEGEYFAMGDNRDSSNDSRYWGFVAEKDLIGKAFAILVSWDNKTHRLRWSRMGTKINS